MTYNWKTIQIFSMTVFGILGNFCANLYIVRSVHDLCIDCTQYNLLLFSKFSIILSYIFYGCCLFLSLALFIPLSLVFAYLNCFLTLSLTLTLSSLVLFFFYNKLNEAIFSLHYFTTVHKLPCKMCVCSDRINANKLGSRSTLFNMTK